MVMEVCGTLGKYWSGKFLYDLLQISQQLLFKGFVAGSLTESTCISLTSQIKWNSRFEGGDWLSSYVSVDGADFRIQEPKPFSSQWYSHKFKGAGVRYELGIALKTGKVVAAHGPFPCGSFSDLSIFRLGMKKALLSQETVVADGGYPDEACIQPKDVSNGLLRQHSLYRARHETLNGKMKNFEVLNQRFRHNLSQHGICFFAVANIVQKCIEDGELSFVV